MRIHFDDLKFIYPGLTQNGGVEIAGTNEKGDSLSFYLTMDKDVTTVSTIDIYKDWYANYGYGIGSVDVVNAGDTQDIPVITLGLWNAAATVNAGEYVTQPSTGANGQVYINSVDSIITLYNVTGAFTNIIAHS